MHVVQCAVCYIEIFDLLLVYVYPPSHLQHFLVVPVNIFFHHFCFFKFSSRSAAFRLIRKSINVWQFIPLSSFLKVEISSVLEYAHWEWGWLGVFTMDAISSSIPSDYFNFSACGELADNAWLAYSPSFKVRKNFFDYNNTSLIRIKTY